MGCDIHIRLEKMNKEGEWESIDYYKIREDWEDSKKYHPSTFPFFPVDIYDGRDYELFGILAGIVIILKRHIKNIRHSGGK